MPIQSPVGFSPYNCGIFIRLFPSYYLAKTSLYGLPYPNFRFLAETKHIYTKSRFYMIGSRSVGRKRSKPPQPHGVPRRSPRPDGLRRLPGRAGLDGPNDGRDRFQALCLPRSRVGLHLRRASRPLRRARDRDRRPLYALMLVGQVRKADQGTEEDAGDRPGRARRRQRLPRRPVQEDRAPHGHHRDPPVLHGLEPEPLVPLGPLRRLPHRRDLLLARRLRRHAHGHARQPPRRRGRPPGFGDALSSAIAPAPSPA